MRVLQVNECELESDECWSNDGPHPVISFDSSGMDPEHMRVRIFLDGRFLLTLGPTSGIHGCICACVRLCAWLCVSSRTHAHILKCVHTPITNARTRIHKYIHHTNIYQTQCTIRTYAHSRRAYIRIHICIYTRTHSRRALGRRLNHHAIPARATCTTFGAALSGSPNCNGCCEWRRRSACTRRSSLRI
jgi:hypothetical protein